MPIANSKSRDEPFVSIVTPVHNGEPYLAECIKSVLSQTHRNFEYIIIDNCCTDRSLEIANFYASIDTRIKIFRNKLLLSQTKNHNYALQNISANSLYCKIVAADDRIFPTCLEAMIAIAECAPNIGVVSGYTLLDWGHRTSIYLTGLPYQQNIFDGHDICRRFFINGIYVFGPPTASLIRSEIVRGRNPFYHEDSVTEDVDVFFEILQSWNFGFVHEIMTYTRRSNESTISSIRDGLMDLTQMVEITKYGKEFLNESEYIRHFKRIKKSYLLMIGYSLLKAKPKKFWDFHRRGLFFAGINLDRGQLLTGLLYAIFDLLFNPKKTADILIAKFFRN